MMKPSGYGRFEPHQSVVLTHGGAGHAWAHVDGCVEAAKRGVDTLARREKAAEAALQAVRTLENDPRFNAGKGATLRIDGQTIQVDAALMDEEDFGAVAGVRNIQNPIILAKAVYQSPHLMLVADGAERLAESLGLPKVNLETEENRQRFDERRENLSDEPFWANHELSGIFQFALESGTACDTVGAVVRDHHGRFAAAGSTGGLWCALPGRVGDTPMPGAGLYVGAAGAVAATGVGEYIWKNMMSLRAYQEMERGASPRESIERVLGPIKEGPEPMDIGLIAVGHSEYAALATREMPWAISIVDDPRPAVQDSDDINTF